MGPLPAAAAAAAVPSAPSSDAALNLNSVSSLFSNALLYLDGAKIPRSVEFPAWSEASGYISWATDAWPELRTRLAAPALRVAVVVCLAMSVMLLVEVVSMAAVSLAVKLLRRRPENRYRWDPIEPGADLEAGSHAFPLVLVQIPMYNEIEVYKLSICAACQLSWPSNRIIVQVLDDSTDLTVKGLVEIECSLWASKGINIKYEGRENRKGFKAGALKHGMGIGYAKQCEFVAIFDSDFQPEPDFLMRTIPFLVHNPNIALVQARWQFVNFSDCLMTRIQKMTLDYHFKVEQEAGSFAFSFFGFNGTAGVWRVSTINEVGGWKDRTTVEDMDLAVRASLKGWKLLYVGDIKVKSELPSTLKAYRNQQHRWTCGAAHLFRKVVAEILKAKEVSIWKKFYLTYSFFLVRKIISHIVTFSLYCIVIPISALVPEVIIPTWGVMYIPTTITFLNAIRNPSSVHLMPFWILFENVMAMQRMKATIIGFLETRTVNEWVVTEKLGDTLQEKIKIPLLEKTPTRLRDRLNFSEIGFAVFLSICASYNLAYGQNYFYVYTFLQSIAFLVVGCGYVGNLISNS